MKYRLLYNKITVVALSAMLSLSAVSCGKLDASKLDGNALTVTETESKEEVKKTEDSSSKKEVEVNEEEKEQPSYTCSLVCVGDNLIHDNIYNEALKLGGGEKYDFTQAYEHVTKYIEGTDVAIINQETLVTDSVEPQSYPMFASPTAVGDKIVDMGFNVVSMSNNHVLDQGEEGLISSLDYWDTKGIVHYGAYRSQEDADTNEVTFENVKAIPIISHFEGDSYYGDWYNCTVYPYAEYTDELFAKNYVEGFTRESVQQCLSYIPDEFLSIE